MNRWLCVVALSFTFLTISPLEASEPTPVSVGAYINDIQNLDLKTHSFSVDIYLWFRWKEPKGSANNDDKLDPSSTIEFVNPYELWGHVRNQDFKSPLQFPGGNRYQVIREQGRFSQKLALYDYPFDRQRLVIDFEDQRSEARDLDYQVDSEGVTMNPELHLPGFVIGKPTFKVIRTEYPTNFGDPRGEKHNIFSRARIEIPIERPVLTYSAKLLVPVFCVILCAALMFLFSPAYVDSRVGIGITTLLTIVALQITLNEDLPEVDYLVLMDKIYLASYLFVISGLGLVVKSTSLLAREGASAAERLDRRSLGFLVTAYLVMMLAIVIPALR